MVEDDFLFYRAKLCQFLTNRYAALHLQELRLFVIIIEPARNARWLLILEISSFAVIIPMPPIIHENIPSPSAAVFNASIIWIIYYSYALD